MGADREPQGGRLLTRLGDILFGDDERVARWVADRVDGFVLREGSPALGVLKDDRLVAGVVFDDYNGIHASVSIAAEPGVLWATRRTLFGLFHYPFVTLDCIALSCVIPSTNLPSLRLCAGLGFHGEAIIRYAAHDGSSLVVMKMLREQCRWIGHGQEQGQGTDRAGPDGDGSGRGAVQPDRHVRA